VRRLGHGGAEVEELPVGRDGVHAPGVAGGEVVAEDEWGGLEGAQRAAAGSVRARVPVRVALVVGDGAVAAVVLEGVRPLAEPGGPITEKKIM
jgi:hypothetical protein